MKVKKLFELNKTSIYNKFNFITCFCMLQFFGMSAIFAFIVALTIEQSAIFIVGGIILVGGGITTITKYIINRIKIKQTAEDALPEPPEGYYSDAIQKVKEKLNNGYDITEITEALTEKYGKSAADKIIEQII